MTSYFSIMQSTRKHVKLLYVAQFSFIVGFMVAAFGIVTVNAQTVDTGNNLCFTQIKKFDSDGNYIAGYGPKGASDGQFLHIHGIAVDKL